MATITWILPNGQSISDSVNDGDNLMEAALMNGVPNVVGECGGCLSCATCHVHVDPAWLAVCPPMGDTENAMLDIVPSGRQENSRLSCQLIAGPALDGLVLHVPAA